MADEKANDKKEKQVADEEEDGRREREWHTINQRADDKADDTRESTRQTMKRVADEKMNGRRESGW